MWLIITIWISLLSLKHLEWLYQIMWCGVLPSTKVYLPRKKNITCGFKSLIMYISSKKFLLNWIECSSIRTELMFILSPGNSTEQATPILNIEIMHSWIFSLQFWLALWVMLFIYVSPSSLSHRRIGSIMSTICSGKAALTKSWRFKLFWKMLSVGLFFVNISNNNIP